LRKSADEPLLALEFENPDHAGSGTPIAVWGEQNGAYFRVRDHELLHDTSSEEGSEQLAARRNALTGQPVKVKQTLAFARVDFGKGIEVTVQQAQDWTFSTTHPGPRMGHGASDKSMVQYFKESTYGQYELSGEVVGPLSFQGNACNGAGGANLARTLPAQVTGKFDHYLWVYGSDEGCGAGWGEQGSWSVPAKNTWVNKIVDNTVIPHEFGHNLGFPHASSMKCSGVPMADDPKTCTTSEYGNPTTVMGGGGIGHLTGVEKWYTQSLGGCNGVRVRSSGTFTLLPLEIPCNGIQVLQVPMVKTTRTFTTDQSSQASSAKYYYLELRQDIGLDTGLRIKPPQILVLISDEIQAPTRSSARTAILDMNPSTNGIDGMTAGMTYQEPGGGVTIKVDSLDTMKATVTVTLPNSSGATTCVDMTTLTGSGPATCDATGGGGMASTGGAGGAGAGTGGVTASGGSSAGGKAGAGGAAGQAGSSGGSSAGGTQQGGAAGATSSGGGGSSGFTSAGSTNGGTSSGGAASGGASLTGGSAGSGPGGASASGGVASGGVATGGLASGGAATSGAAGTPTSGGKLNTGGQSVAGQAGSAVPPPVSSEAGCGCKVPAPRHAEGGLPLSAALGLAGMVWRRRRQRQTPRHAR
jgi:hypothetical protein